ncbi:unnamed protein product [Pleuronectes platessa]|uniref:Uncharacterized protein n=1 Tax=Pleuronectes platessa TaxID=8262 RepID=A0A9N7VXU2_PLEPL|nr:unnamed protein product [Pleuronectes platessa]
MEVETCVQREEEVGGDAPAGFLPGIVMKEKPGEAETPSVTEQLQRPRGAETTGGEESRTGERTGERRVEPGREPEDLSVGSRGAGPRLRRGHGEQLQLRPVKGCDRRARFSADTVKLWSSVSTVNTREENNNDPDCVLLRDTAGTSHRGHPHPHRGHPHPHRGQTGDIHIHLRARDTEDIAPWPGTHPAGHILGPRPPLRSSTP